ncbi:hypothetical protein [Caulobacter sp. LjRoot300]|uniref:hypothetical protein n=1 Tax=Caulobacter sp. LjRoot300 TaxID=3342321 RepID=UPI003ED0EAD6
MSDEVEEIVVIGNPPYQPSPEVPGYTPSPGGGPPPPGSPGGPPPVTLEPAATTYAAARVKTGSGLNLDDPKQKAWYDQGQQALKGLFFNTQFGSKTTIDGAGTKDVAETKLLDVLNKTTFVFQTDPVVFQGQEVSAKTTKYTDSSGGVQYVVYIDVDHASAAAMQNLGASGMNFLLFHEIGHAVAADSGWAGSATAEADANTFAMGLADYAYFAVPNQTTLSGMGYDFTPF